MKWETFCNVDLTKNVDNAYGPEHRTTIQDVCFGLFNEVNVLQAKSSHVCLPLTLPQIRSLATSCPSDLQRGNVFAWPDFLHGLTGRVKTSPKSMFCAGEQIYVKHWLS